MQWFLADLAPNFWSYVISDCSCLFLPLQHVHSDGNCLAVFWRYCQDGVVIAVPGFQRFSNTEILLVDQGCTIKSQWNGRSTKHVKQC